MQELAEPSGSGWEVIFLLRKGFEPYTYLCIYVCIYTYIWKWIARGGCGQPRQRIMKCWKVGEDERGAGCGNGTRQRDEGMEQHPTRQSDPLGSEYREEEEK